MCQVRSVVVQVTTIYYLVSGSTPFGQRERSCESPCHRHWERRGQSIQRRQRRNGLCALNWYSAGTLSSVTPTTKYMNDNQQFSIKKTFSPSAIWRNTERTAPKIYRRVLKQIRSTKSNAHLSKYNAIAGFGAFVGLYWIILFWDYNNETALWILSNDNKLLRTQQALRLSLAAGSISIQRHSHSWLKMMKPWPWARIAFLKHVNVSADSISCKLF